MMKPRQWQILFFLPLFLLVGCEKYYVTVKREYVDQMSLASTFVKSPDPLQSHPPKGQELSIEWRLPRDVLEQNLKLVISLVFKNDTTEVLTYDIDKRRGVVTYSLLNEEYKASKGFLTYKAEIIGQDGEVIKEWKQQLWTELITLDDNEPDLGCH